MQPVVFVVPGKAGATGHERVVAVADGVCRDIAEVGGQRISGSGAVGLLRHSDRLVPPDEDQLRAVDVVRFDQDSIPRGISRAWGEGRTGSVVVGRNPRIDYVTITLPEPGI